MKEKDEWTAPYDYTPSENTNEDNKKSKSKLFNALSIAAVVILAAVMIFFSVSKMADNKQKNVENGYSSFEYNKNLKAVYNTSKECQIGDFVYTLTENPRNGYALENKGQYNKYGFYFGSIPDFYMMRYDETDNEFWFVRQMYRYPDISKDKIEALILPDRDSKTYGQVETEIVRIDFGTEPVTINDANIISTAKKEYKSTHNFIYVTDAVEHGTPIYAKFENNCMYFLLGFTAEE